MAQLIQKNGLYFLRESPLLESKVEIQNVKADNSLVFRGIMQLTEVMNANRRIYPTELMERHLATVQPMVSKRALFGEADHPDADAPPHRIMIVRMKDSSHCFKKLWVDKDSDRGIVRAECETTPNKWGYALAAFIRRGMGVGFSLRSTGRVAPRGNVSYVTEPFRFVTYDSVINPSNEGAFVEAILEEASNNIKECYLSESKTLTPLIEQYIEMEVRECVMQMLKWV